MNVRSLSQIALYYSVDIINNNIRILFMYNEIYGVEIIK